VARIRSAQGPAGVEKLYAIWAIESLLAKKKIVANEEEIWEAGEKLEEGLDAFDQKRFTKVKAHSDRLGKQVNDLELQTDLDRLKNDLGMGRMEIPQAVLQRLNGLEQVPMSYLVNTNAMPVNTNAMPMDTNE
jgi:hypothetical protein